MKIYPLSPQELQLRARHLRASPTNVEALLWSRLRRRQLANRRFRRQHILSPYIVDFYCPAERLAIELDGSSHHDPTRENYDTQRDAFLLQNYNVKVIRFHNYQVREDLNAVLLKIRNSFSS